jgi:hypothetical protein
MKLYTRLRLASKLRMTGVYCHCVIHLGVVLTNTVTLSEVSLYLPEREHLREQHPGHLPDNAVAE